jgi:hypothetical protein
MKNQRYLLLFGSSVAYILKCELNMIIKKPFVVDSLLHIYMYIKKSTLLTIEIIFSHTMIFRKPSHTHTLHILLLDFVPS